MVQFGGSTCLVTIATDYLSYSFIICVVLGIDAAIIDIINERSVKDMVWKCVE